MKQIIKIKFGSHLYGTSTPASDVDFKSVFIPDARSILLQRTKGSINDQRPKAEFEKNTAGEIEEERFSLQRFLGLAAEGQTVALDMLFAPSWSFVAEPSPVWYEILDNRHRLVSRRSKAFIGYAMKQASKYGVKGSRVAASRNALNILARGMAEHGTVAKLEVMAEIIKPVAETDEHMAIVPITMPNGGVVDHWEVCGRKMPYSSSIKNAHGIMQRLVEEYGHRALQAESNQGVDWKALSHAVRVGHQAIELLNTGFVTFPLPNAAHIVAIKKGQLDYKIVVEEIETVMNGVLDAADKSPLPDEPDMVWIDDFVFEMHRREVVG